MGYQKWANTNTNMNIQIDIHKYKYVILIFITLLTIKEYIYLYQACNLWYLVYINLTNSGDYIFCLELFFTTTNMNIFGSQVLEIQI